MDPTSQRTFYRGYLKAFSWFSLPFALPFIGIGCFMIGGNWTEIRLSHRILATWVEVPAHVESFSMQWTQSAHRAIGEYSYELDGRKYTATRIGLDEVPDDIGDHHQHIHALMAEVQVEGGTLPCRVNPANPSEAILWPYLRPEIQIFRALFGGAFGGAGIGMLLSGVVRLRQISRRDALQRKHPDQPWNWRLDWQSKRLPMRKVKWDALWAGLTLVLIQASSLSLWSVLVPESENGRNVSAWVLISLLVSTGASGLALSIFLRWWKFRETYLELADNPILLGNPRRARLFLDYDVPAQHDLILA